MTSCIALWQAFAHTLTDLMKEIPGLGYSFPSRCSESLSVDRDGIGHGNLNHREERRGRLAGGGPDVSGTVGQNPRL
jgi:hypothetical protein